MSLSVVSSRRPSLAVLYNNLKNDLNPYEELENAARLFPVDEDDVEETYPAFSISSSQSPPPRFEVNDADSDSGSDSSSDSDSDVEPMDLSPDAYGSDSVVIYNDTPFMPSRQASPQIAQPRETSAPPKPKPLARNPPPRVAPSPPPSYQRRQRKRARLSVSEDADRDADSESTGDATDDEYVPSPSLKPRKRVRSSSPAPYRRTSASPAASNTSSDHPNKRPRMPPQSRNKQASRAEIQRVESAEDFNDFVCPVCGWVQKNERIPDFKRHLKTHKRAVDEAAEKGWRCKGVPVSEAADYGLGAAAPAYDFQGQRWVGGCLKTFSRRDALKRHLDNDNVSCVGNLDTANEP